MLALRVAERADVLVVTKKRADDSNTNCAQGGIAAVFDARTRSATTSATRCAAAPASAIADGGAPGGARGARARARAGGAGRGVQSRGARLSRWAARAGTRARRIVHARDFTGRAIEQALLERVRRHPRIELLENQLAVDLHPGLAPARASRRAAAMRCWGAYVMDRNDGRIRADDGARDRARHRRLRARCTSTPPIPTSRPATAWRWRIARACRSRTSSSCSSIPTCLYHPGAKSFLLSEALRGEGAVLRTLDGTRFMPGVHPLAELAPRDVVARAIDREMKRRGEPHVLLDITHVPRGAGARALPEHRRRARSARPRSHPRADPGGAGGALHVRRRAAPRWRGAPRSRGLFAIGEVACTGLHGANRLASNSLLEALVGAHHAAAAELAPARACAARAARPSRGRRGARARRSRPWCSTTTGTRCAA